MNTLPFKLALITTVLLSACSETSTVDTNNGDDVAIADSRNNLQTFENADAFTTALKEALVHQGSNDFIEVDAGATDDVDFVLEAVAVDEGSASEEESTDSTSAGDDISAEDNEVTSTNVQEVGVDEQDRVKLNAAGTELFVLHNEYRPFEEPITPEETGEVTTGAIADNSQAVQRVEPELASRYTSKSSFVEWQDTVTTLRILSLDSETPDATQSAELEIDFDGREANGFYLYEADEQAHAIVTSSSGGYWAYWNDSAAFAEMQSIIAKVNVTSAADATVEETFTLDGQIISSRRIGDSLFFASRYYPSIPGVEPGQQGTQQWESAVDAADIGELIPQYTISSTDGDSVESSALITPSDCFVAPVEDNQAYYSPDIITLGMIDLKTMQLQDTQCFLGATETLYANTQSVFLATTKYSYEAGPITEDGQSVDVAVDVFDPDLVWYDERTTTELHKFDIQSDRLSYEGSGSVRGHLGWNELQKPFRMSERDGYLRIATMNDQQGPDHSPILLNVLQADGQGNLALVSSLPNETYPEHIGKPGEQLYASRFLDDRAYLVTFRQTDPLYVVDLADPVNPQVTGELEIEGYSDYLHPIGENYLLGIGKDAISADGGQGDGRGAWVQGIKLSLFDVTDPVLPLEIQSVLVGERGTSSVALGNHRAITIQAATEAHPTRVSFGIDVYGDAFPASSPSSDQAFNYSNWSYTGLHGFDIEVGVNPGIASRGALIVERADPANGIYYPQIYGDDRSVMVNDALYYVHGERVYPALWDNLASEPVGR